jgi:hypothetical protein
MSSILVNTTTMIFRRTLGLQITRLEEYVECCLMYETQLESSKLVIIYRYLISDTRKVYYTCRPSNIASL